MSADAHMSADTRIYYSERLARCYAADRPPLHGAICARLFSSLPLGYLARTALDIGCGTGASTLALAPYVSAVTGVDPFPRMLRAAGRPVRSRSTPAVGALDVSAETCTSDGA